MPDEPLDAQVRFAIANKRLVQLTYHGAPRVAEPHDYEDLLVLRETFPGSRGHEHSNHYVWDVLYARVE
jgi:hypothetical protein